MPHCRNFEEQRAFLQQTGIPVAMIGLLQAIPGTSLHKRVEREGRLREMPVSGVRGTAESLLLSKIAHRTMSQREMADGFQSLVKAFYDYAAFGDRLIESLSRSRKARHRRKMTINAQQLTMLARIPRHYLWTWNHSRRRLFARVMAATLRLNLDIEMALMHLVVYKHLRAFYCHLASLPMPAREYPLNSQVLEEVSLQAKERLL